MERDEAARLAALTQGEVLTAVSQISAAVGTMDHVTQQNAAIVEQTSAALRNLASDVNALAEQSARTAPGREWPRPPEACARKWSPD